jgi:hypothetical protein
MNMKQSKETLPMKVNNNLLSFMRDALHSTYRMKALANESIHLERIFLPIGIHQLIC